MRDARETVFEESLGRPTVALCEWIQEPTKERLRRFEESLEAVRCAARMLAEGRPYVCIGDNHDH